ncbi:MAG: 2-amino-4-hydroxy-6-hydroxymethyldihydropteridine diphosphokinase [Mariprofundaceae bacterium]|nr:2-amino-4-hydroxy-6-hydroxymethyldihydropteridine diphosphokinase [Mariprofundaceae bacterium]
MPTHKKTPASHVWVALGGNQGDVYNCFKSARKSIAKHPSCELLQSSLLYQTPPLGSVGQADYLNAVIAISTYLEPLDLLQVLQNIEHAHGRIRQEHWGARTLDLDILAYDNLHLQSNILTLPHSQLHVRQFVLRPLCDIAPLWLHPSLRKNASELLQSLLDSGEEPLENGSLW